MPHVELDEIEMIQPISEPPLISPFNFDDLKEGQRTSISCNVMSGDLPISISWLKDSLPIPQHLNITPMRVKFLSNLIFEELKEEHSGLYSCTASNEVASSTYSAQLSVKGNCLPTGQVSFPYYH